MRKIIETDTGQSDVEMPDAYVISYAPRATPAQRARLEETMTAVREEVIAAMQQVRPPILHVPPGLLLTIHLQGYTIPREDDEDDDD